MKLSEAIRKGCEGKRKIKQALHDNKGGICALGAAFEAVDLSVYIKLYVEFPELRWMKPFDLEDYIIDLNDRTDLSIPEIADIVEAMGA